MENSPDWMDFHATFIILARSALTARLPDEYDIRVDERLTLVETSRERVRHMRPDLAIERDAPTFSTGSGGGAVATLDPVTLTMTVEEETRETFLEIYRRPARTLVTVIELLSPTNKNASGRAAYLAKRHAVWQEPVHLLEIDLLLEGERLLPVTRDYPAGDYFAILSRQERRPNCEVYHWSVRDPLPTIPVPLSAPDPDIPLDLAAVFKETFQAGRYERSLGYQAPPKLEIAPPTRDWIAAQAAQPQPTAAQSPATQ